MISIWGTTIGYFLWGIAWDLKAFMALRFLTGLSSNSMPILNTYISEIVPVHLQSTYNGYYTGMTAIIAIFCPTITIGLDYGSDEFVETEQQRYRIICFFCGIIALIAAAWTMLKLEEVPEERRKRRTQDVSTFQ